MSLTASKLETERLDPSDELQKEFRLFRNLCAEFGSSLGLRTEELKSRSIVGQTRVLHHLRMFNDLIAGSVHILSKNSEHLYLRLALRKFGWRVPNEVFEELGENDTIEIYGMDLALIVANLRFAEVCSYNIDEVLDNEFFEIFDRDPSITEALVGATKAIFSRETEIIRNNGNVFPLGPDHHVYEKFSTEKRRFWVQSRFVAAVRDTSNQVVGVIYSATVNPL